MNSLFFMFAFYFTWNPNTIYLHTAVKFIISLFFLLQWKRNRMRLKENRDRINRKLYCALFGKNGIYPNIQSQHYKVNISSYIISLSFSLSLRFLSPYVTKMIFWHSLKTRNPFNFLQLGNLLSAPYWPLQIWLEKGFTISLSRSLDDKHFAWSIFPNAYISLNCGRGQMLNRIYLYWCTRKKHTHISINCRIRWMLYRKYETIYRHTQRNCNFKHIHFNAKIPLAKWNPINVNIRLEFNLNVVK